MSINVYNCDAHPWFKNMILIARKSIINGISEKRFAANFKPVKNRCFSVATLDGMCFSLISLLRKKPATLVLHKGNNNS